LVWTVLVTWAVSGHESPGLRKKVGLYVGSSFDFAWIFSAVDSFFKTMSREEKNTEK